MPVFDRDPLSDRWVIHAPARSDRPGTNEGDQLGCPFCPGNESATPDEALRIAGTDGRWAVRVFPNLYPAVEPTDDPGGADTRPGSGRSATGAHEVIVLSPDHRATFADLDDDQAASVALAVHRRVAHHREAGRPYVQPFINQGRDAGATVEHPHGQLLALDVVPPAVTAEERVLADEPCPLCLLLDGQAVVGQRGNVAVASPAWAAGPFEMLLGPVAHTPFDAGDPAELGTALRDALTALRRVAGDVDHNVVLHVSPRHWHAHIRPRTTVVAGFELGSGVAINPSSPERDRVRLRAAWPG